MLCWFLAYKMRFYFFQDTTYARLMEELSSHALPLMWDDVSNVAQLESIAVMCYNRVIMKILIFLKVISSGLSLRFEVARGIHLTIKEANS